MLKSAIAFYRATMNYYMKKYVCLIYKVKTSASDWKVFDAYRFFKRDK